MLFIFILCYFSVCLEYNWTIRFYSYELIVFYSPFIVLQSLQFIVFYSPFIVLQSSQFIVFYEETCRLRGV